MLKTFTLLFYKELGFFSLYLYCFSFVSEIVYDLSVPLCNEKVMSERQSDRISSSMKQTPPWPAPVSCEMSVDAWRTDLEKFDFMEKYGYLIKGFVDGFHQGIPSHSIDGLDWYCPPNHSSALKVREKIQKNIDKEVMAMRMFGPFSKEYVFSKMGFLELAHLEPWKMGISHSAQSMTYLFLEMTH